MAVIINPYSYRGMAVYHVALRKYNTWKFSLRRKAQVAWFVNVDIQKGCERRSQFNKKPHTKY